MKKVLLSNLLLSLCFIIYGQTYSSIFSPFSKLFIYHYEECMTDEGLSRYEVKRLSEISPITTINGQYYIGALIQIDEHFNTADLQRMGCLIGYQNQKIISVKIPLHQLAAVAAITGINYIALDVQQSSFINKALEDTKIGQVHAGSDGLPMPFTGEGVIIGFIDNGFDFTHPAFRSQEEGTLRIKKVWNQHESGPPPSGYNYGVELSTTNNILARLNDGVYHTSHGTHVAGIGAGSGFGVTENKGVAPNSELMLVSKAEGNSSTVDAIAYLFDQAEESGHPIVVNMSFGNQLGHAHDGRSLEDQVMEDLIEPGKMLVASAGNGGDQQGHLEHLFETEPIQCRILHPNGYTQGLNQVHLWGKPGISFSASVNIYNSNDQLLYQSNSYPASANVATGETYQSDEGWIQVSFAAEAFSPTNGRPNILVEINLLVPTPGNFYVDLLINASPGNEVHAWSNDKGFFHSPVGSNLSVEGNNERSIAGAGANSDAVISCGAYTTRNEWVSLENEVVTISNLAIGARTSFSSRGPTMDGRTKPDITAPGEWIISAFSRFDEGVPESYGNQISHVFSENNKNWHYGALSGTSQATPIVAGVIALMLEANPNLDTEEIRSLLHNSARQDAFTGPISSDGDNQWGWGKINGLQALKMLTGVVETENQIKNKIKIYPNPTHGELYLDLEGSYNQVTKVELFDIYGKKWLNAEASPDFNKALDVSNLPPGIYFAWVDQVFITKILVF